MSETVENLLQKVVNWAGSQESVLGIALVGSYARNEARPDSDVDLILLSEKPAKLLNDTTWLSTFGKTTSNKHGDYGPVQSKHVFYEDGLEVEFGITTPEWAATQLVDSGTRRVVKDGMRILYDPKDMFRALEAASRTSDAV